MKLSIIVPIYNAEEYLNCCIESIINQSYKSVEIILVDNNSVDSSLSICRRYEALNDCIRVLEEPKCGPFYARKRGVLEATGEYITFVDADDFVDENSYALAERDMESGIEGIFFDIYRFFGEDSIRYDSSWKTEKTYDKQMIIEELYPRMLWDKKNASFGIDPSLCCKIFRAEKIKNLFQRIDTINFHYGEDVAITYPLILGLSTISVHNVAYYYHRQNNAGEIPRYIMDNGYLEKLFSLYSFLKTEFSDYPIFNEQIDLFYIKSVELVKKKYGVDNGINKKYLFPFSKVDRNEKIILYGAGNVGSQYMEQIKQTNFCSVILWVDKNVRRPEVYPIEDICKYSFDKVVIAIEDGQIVERVKKTLGEMNIDNEKIVY